MVRSETKKVCPLTPNEQNKLRAFEDRVQRRIFKLNRDDLKTFHTVWKTQKDGKKQEDGENFIMNNFVICTLQEVLLRGKIILK